MSSVQVDQNEVIVDDNDMMTNLIKKDDEIYSKSSSIGVLSHGDSGDDEDGEEAQSKGLVEEGSLNSLAALEAALPFKLVFFFLSFLVSLINLFLKKFPKIFFSFNFFHIIFFWI